MLPIKQWRERLTEQTESMREQFRGFWTNLAPRERLILSVAAGLCSLVILIFGVQQLSQLFLYSGNSLERSLQDAQKIQSLVEELKAGRFQARRYDRLREQRPDDFKLEAFLEEQANRFGVEISQINPRRVTSATAANEAERLFEVDLERGASLDAALRFLESVEDSLGLRIVELSMKPQFDDASKLDVGLVIAYRENL